MRARLAPVLLLLAVLATVGSSFAFAPGAPGRFDALVRVPELEAAYDSETQTALREGHSAVARLERAAGGTWHVSFDQSNGGVRRAIGKGVAWLPGAGNDLEPRAADPELADLEAMARAFLSEYGSLFAGQQWSEWTVAAEGSQPLMDGRVWPIRFTRAVAGIPVEYAQVTLIVNNGNMAYVNATGLSEIPVSPVPTLDDAGTWSAFAAVAADANLSVVGAEPVGRPELLFTPTQPEPGAAFEYRLVRRHQFQIPGDLDSWSATVDAHSGELLGFWGENRYACALDPTKVQGKVIGGVRAAQATDPEEVRNMILPLVIEDGISKNADSNGYYLYDGGLSETRLQGTFFDQHCDGCNPDPPLVTNDLTGILDLGTGGNNQITNGFSTPADRTAHYHLNAARQMAAKWIARPWFDTSVPVNVNIASTCNAFWNGVSVNFYRSGGGCNNTGEIRDVMQHEWGHGLDSNDGVGSVDRAMGEAYGDHIAIFIDRDSCIGQSFFGNSSGPYCETNPDCTSEPTCDGVRNVDEKRTTLGLMTMTTAQTKCSASPCGPSPLNRQCHCESQTYGQAAFHLAYNFLLGEGYDSGLPLPGANPGFSEVKAWFVHERTFFNAGTIQSSYAPSNRQSFGIGAYDAYIMVDDDDGNPLQTPHAEYINDAFIHHEIQEPSIAADDANCLSPADPPFTLTPLLDDITGNAQVEIAWNEVNPVPDFYVVYRNLKLSDVWIPVRDVVLAGQPSYVVYDEPIQVGEEYNYIVVAVGVDGCPSEGSSPQSIIVALPESSATIGAIDDPPPGGDGDLIPEPGELVRVRVDLSEVAGLVGLQNAQVTLSTSDPFATVVVPGPILYGDIPASGTVNGPSMFEVGISVSHACGSNVPLVAAVSAENGCLLVPFALQIPSAGCVPQARGEAIPAGMSITADNLDPACTDNDGFPDNGESVNLDVTVENPGTAAANNVTVELIPQSPNLTVTSTNPVSIASLGNGSSDTASFTVQLGDLAGCYEPFDVAARVNSDDNLFPIEQSETFTAEEDQTSIVLTADFETDFSGWAAIGFTRSNNRTNGGSAFAAYSGAGFNHVCDASSDDANNCSSLTSPAFVPGPAALLLMSTWYNIEPRDTQFWDRANVHVIDVVSGNHTLIEPFAGRFYNGGNGDGSNLCHNSSQNGWAGVGSTWQSSQFDLQPWAGQEIQVEVTYNTDDLATCEGFYVDDIQVTDARQRTCDALVCSGAAPNIVIDQCLANDICLSAGIGDGVLDPGDQVTYDITLRNTGSADAVDVQADITVTGGIPVSGQTIGGGPQLDITMGGFYVHQLVVEVTGLCGEALDIDIDNLRSTGNSFPPDLGTCDMPIGADIPAQVVVVEDVVNPPATIEAQSPWLPPAISRTMAMNIPTPVTGATISIDVSHGRLSDLTAYLESPLSNLLDVTAAIGGSIDVSALVNADGPGDYILWVSDIVDGEVGTLDRWALDVDTPGYVSCNPCDSTCLAPVVTIDASASSTCHNTSVQFSANFSDPGSGGFDYEWDLGDPDVGGPMLVTANPFAPVSHLYDDDQPSYTVTLRALSKSDSSCDATAMTTVTIDSGTVPAGSVDNLLRGVRSGLGANWSWAGSGVTPPQFIVHKAFDKVELPDTPTGIGDEAVIARVAVESASDLAALAASPALAFYEVHVATSCGVTEFP